MNRIPNTRPHYSIEYSTLKYHHARTSNMQKLDLSDTMIANPQVFNKDDYVYLLKEPLRGKFDEQYKGPDEILEILGNNNIKLAISDKRIRIAQ